jgi:hypothetical protein
LHVEAIVNHVAVVRFADRARSNLRPMSPEEAMKILRQAYLPKAVDRRPVRGLAAH